MKSIMDYLVISKNMATMHPMEDQVCPHSPPHLTFGRLSRYLLPLEPPLKSGVALPQQSQALLQATEGKMSPVVRLLLAIGGLKYK